MMNQYHNIKTNQSFTNIFILIVICGSSLFVSLTATAQIEVDGQYWKYNGSRVLLLGGWNHGHNPFIDHDTDNDNDKQGVSTVAQITEEMDELANAGGNYLRCVLDPGMAAGIQGFDFCAKPGEKYNLNDMTGAFWERIEMFISEAKKRDIIVQIELWDRFDLTDGGWNSWPVSPWNPKNNSNYTTESSGLKQSYGSFQNHPFLQCVPGHPVYEKAPQAQKQQYDVIRAYQEKFVDKLLSITLKYNNVLYCMNNETHEHPAWGQYWMKWIKDRANKQGKKVETTDMFDDIFRADKSHGVAYLIDQRNLYDYADISQANSRHRDEDHWNAVLWLSKKLTSMSPPYLLHMTKIYGNDLALDGNPWGGFAPGDSDNAIEEWWRDLLSGVAGVRFHRPTAGIGLCDASKNCMRATRKVESRVKFWDVKPRMDLLSNRKPDGAYLAAEPGKAYILYFTKNGNGAVDLKLGGDSMQDFGLQWINIDTGEFGSKKTISGGGTVQIQRPSDSAHWAATIVKK
ncbi:hypothetical protein K8I31_16155 [bacterium]|nr:hypothetical protein [bacterium]